MCKKRGVGSKTVIEIETGTCGWVQLDREHMDVLGYHIQIS
jgi:hypothetical protein